MEKHSSLSHTRWQCKYHVIFIPKYRRKRLCGVVKQRLGEVFHRLAELLGQGGFADTVGRDTEVIRAYIRNQEAEDRRFDQLEFSDELSAQSYTND